MRNKKEMIREKRTEEIENIIRVFDKVNWNYLNNHFNKFYFSSNILLGWLKQWKVGKCKQLGIFLRRSNWSWNSRFSR